MDLWSHQRRGIDDTLSAIARGERRILVTSPTGGGKTRIMAELIRHYLESAQRVVLYTNRRMLVDQTSGVLHDHGLYHGIRAAGHEESHDQLLQVSSIQTENSRYLKRQCWPLHAAQLVLVDEAHMQAGNVARKILSAHVEQGAAYVGLTATPIDLGDLYETLVVAGTNSELRDCGALVECLHYGPDEPDLRKLKNLQVGKDLSGPQIRKVMWTPTLFGRVWEHFEKLNPFHWPAILFAPGVRESIWFCEQFRAKGVAAAHIDGKDIWLDGKLHPTSQALREDVLAASRDRRITVLCNRFVLREGIDAPWLQHGIFATVFGSLQSYLQSGGRLLRSHPGKSSVTLQDHGGNWHRHGSLNTDREWRLEYTASMVAGLREERLRQKKEKEPVRCPQCSRILLTSRCPLPCGFEVQSVKKSRPVVTTEGTLVLMHGDIYRPRRTSCAPDGQKDWVKMYHRSLTEKGSKTFRQAFACYAKEHDWAWPDPTWPFMPLDPLDEFRLVADVPREKLRPYHATVTSGL